MPRSLLRPTPVIAADVRPHWQAPALWWSLLIQTVVVVGLTVAAGLTVGGDVPDTAFLWAMPTLVIPVTGAILAARRGRGRRNTGAVLIRAGLYAGVIVGAGIAQLVVVFVASLIGGDVALVTFGSVLTCVGGGLLAGAFLLVVGGSLHYAETAPPGSGPVDRWVLAVLFAALFAALLGRAGESTSVAWLWTARVAAAVLLLALAFLARALRRRARALTGRPPSPARPSSSSSGL